MSSVPHNSKAVVQFDSDDGSSLAVVASTWLTEDHTECYWPPPSINPTKVAQRKTDPFDNSKRIWSLQRCTVLKHFVDFLNAQRYCDRATKTTDPETTDCELRSKRKRTSKRLDFSPSRSPSPQKRLDGSSQNDQPKYTTAVQNFGGLTKKQSSQTTPKALGQALSDRPTTSTTAEATVKC